MKEVKDKTHQEYSSILTAFLSGAGETSLERGYELGRNTLDTKLGILVIAEAYVSALTETLLPVSPECARMVAATRDLLSASLASFEMTHQGYQASIAKLQKFNLILESQATELASVNRELEAFSTSVSHDLHAPVRAMEGFAQALREGHSMTLNEEGRGILSRIEKSANQMGELIEGLLSLARFGQQALSFEAVDLGKMSKEIFSELRSAAPKRQVEFAVGENLTVRGDRQLLRVVLNNLLANSWKFTAKTTASRIEVGRILLREGGSAFFVRDNGAGFDMKYFDKLFGPFQRLHTREQFDGTGIGLATVRRIVERHGGRTWAEGVLGKGATFYFTLDTDLG